MKRPCSLSGAVKPRVMEKQMELIANVNTEQQRFSPIGLQNYFGQNEKITNKLPETVVPEHFNK
jgi:hypothetical protein